MRLDKYLANSGIGTRKEVKDILKKRKVKVNKIIEKDGSKHIDEKKDVIEVDDKIVLYKPFVYIMMNKPNGVISATEDKNHKTVVDLLQDNYKTYDVFPVGRLDIDTEGLLILTNDGKLSHNLLAPNKHIDKKYYVELRENINDSDIQKLENGIKLEENFITKNAKVEIIENKKVYITITEGKFHQVKRMFRAVENEVLYLKRVKIGNIELDSKLEIGSYRELTEDEINLLKKDKN